MSKIKAKAKATRANPKSAPANPNGPPSHMEVPLGTCPILSATKTPTAPTESPQTIGAQGAEPSQEMPSPRSNPSFTAAREEEYRHEPTSGSITRARPDPPHHQLKGGPLAQGVPSQIAPSPGPCIATLPQISAPATATPGLIAHLKI